MSLVPYKRNPEEDKKILEALLKEPDTPPSSVGFAVQELTDSYSIQGIQFRNEVYAVDVAKQLLPSRTQDEHAEHALNARPNEFRAASAPLIYAICKALHEHENNPQCAGLVENIRADLQAEFANPWINTLSRVTYNSHGTDEVVHDYKQKTQYSKRIALVGPDGLITDPKSKAIEYVQALLNTADKPEEINAVFKWITDKNSYAYRLNSTPNDIQEGVVTFGVSNSGKFKLSAYFNTVGLAFGVRVAKISTGNNG